MPDYAQSVIFWIAGTLFGLGVASRGEKDAKNICVLALGSLACAVALVFLLGVTAEVLQTTNVNRLIQGAAEMLSVDDRREKASPAAVETPTPPPETPVPGDISAPADDTGPPNWLIWLLYTPEMEG